MIYLLVYVSFISNFRRVGLMGFEVHLRCYWWVRPTPGASCSVSDVSCLLYSICRCSPTRCRPHRQTGQRANSKHHCLWLRSVWPRVKDHKTGSRHTLSSMHIVNVYERRKSYQKPSLAFPCAKRQCRSACVLVYECMLCVFDDAIILWMCMSNPSNAIADEIRFEQKTL